MAAESKVYLLVLSVVVLFLTTMCLFAEADDTLVVPVQVDTNQPPSNLTVSVQLDQEGRIITATFRGGYGQTLLNKIDLELIRPDGSTEIKTLGNTIGESVILNGSGCGDRVTGKAYFKTGDEYDFLNETMQYLKDLCAVDYIAASDPCEVISGSAYLKTDPVDIIPANKSVAVQVNTGTYNINVQFRGGFGQNLVKSIKVTRIGPDGTEETKDLLNYVGDEVTFNATNNCMDRLTVDVDFIDGTTYHIYDKVLDYLGLHY